LYIRPSGPRTIGEVLDDGLKLWREAFSKTWLLAMLGRMVVAVPSIFLVNRTIDTARLTAAQKFSMMMGQSAEHLWIFYLLLLISYIFYTAILWRVAAVAENREVGMGESLKKGLTLLPRLLLFYIFLIIGRWNSECRRQVLAHSRGGGRVHRRGHRDLRRRANLPRLCRLGGG
jgi:hypothetical protein